MSISKSAEREPLDYGCSDWRASSQRSANAYRLGLKLWTKSDLHGIEQQLSDSTNREFFIVHSIHGDEVRIKNPTFGETCSIWRPFVKFQEYWRLVKAQPDGPPGTYHCSYLVDWTNQSARDFRFTINEPFVVFEENRRSWLESRSYDVLKTWLAGFLSTKKATKVVCFGLGDICREPPEWFKRQEHQNDAELSDTELMRNFVRPSMVQHLIALTIAEMCGEIGGNKVQLLTQDPDYSEQTKEVLAKSGFSIVGQFGAGGFAEIDDDTVVFSAFVEAPLKQIIADIARPVLVITTDRDTFNDFEKPWADAESPRTREMWQDYKVDKFQ
ncbi:hypothetical protein CDV31_017103, partial [Fusarium ambrosium]